MKNKDLIKILSDMSPENEVKIQGWCGTGYTNITEIRLAFDNPNIIIITDISINSDRE